MKIADEIVIAAPAPAIYALASGTEAWPRILPHYRWVRIVREDGNRRIVEMGAKRPVAASGLAIRVRWRAEQVNDPGKPLVTFRHLGGWTGGMQVAWRFEPVEGGTRVTIDHELRSPLAPFIARWFIHPIASRTLACMKAFAETKQ